MIVIESEIMFSLTELKWQLIIMILDIFFHFLETDNLFKIFVASRPADSTVKKDLKYVPSTRPVVYAKFSAK